MKKDKQVILTGDRPTGALHLGHFIGSLASRLALEDDYKQYIMIADAQALTDHAEHPELIKKHIMQVALDYLSVGIDPKKSTIFIQSMIPELFELTSYYLNLVTWNRLKHNPTVKLEIRQKGFKEHVPAGFMVYPISQAADITAFLADLVPVGDDQIPMIEQTVEIVRKFNRIYHCDILVEPKAYVSKISRLPGIDGQAKMSKTLKNEIALNASTDEVAQKVRKMYTDPNHIHIDDPGKIEGNCVFTYLDAFDPDITEVSRLKEHYQRGGLGDGVVKKRLIEVLEAFLTPIRQRRALYSNDLAQVEEILKKGTEAAQERAAETLKRVRQAIGIDYSSRSSISASFSSSISS